MERENSRETYDGRRPGLTQRQYVTGGEEESNLKRRWRAYDFMIGGNTFTEEYLGALEVSPNESVADIGCNEGRDLAYLRQLGHVGLSIGIDVDPQIFETSPHYRSQAPERPIQFISARAEALPLEPRSLDVITASFMLYHVAEPDKALRNMSECLRPGGRLGITTSGPNNKPRHRAFERKIAQHLGVTPPPLFNASFDSHKLRDIYRSWPGPATVHGLATSEFDDMKLHEENKAIRFTNESYGAYIDSLASMRSEFNPSLADDDSVWREAIEAVVEPEITEAIKSAGYFEDSVERAYLICRKRT